MSAFRVPYYCSPRYVLNEADIPLKSLADASVPTPALTHEYFMTIVAGWDCRSPVEVPGKIAGSTGSEYVVDRGIIMQALQ